MNSECSYEQWVENLFGCSAATDSEFIEDDDDDEKSLLSPPADAIDYITRLFNDPTILMDTYSREQLSKGLWFLASCTIGIGYGWPFLSPHVTNASRIQCIRGTFSLFEKLFARHCAEEYGHLITRDGDPLNSPCYMWFDLFWYHDQENPALVMLNDHVIDTLENILALPSNPCRESAVHGLGHLMVLHPERIGIILDNFLTFTRDIPKELSAYAIKAKSRRIL